MDSAGLTIKLKIKEHGKEIASFTHFSNTHDHKLAHACAFSEFIGSETFKQLNHALGGEYTIDVSFLVNTVMPGTTSQKELVLSFAQKYFVEDLVQSFLTKIGYHAKALEESRTIVFYQITVPKNDKEISVYEIQCKKHAELYLFGLSYEKEAEAKTLCITPDMRKVITTLLFLIEMTEASN